MESLFRREWLAGDYKPLVNAYYFKQWNTYNMDYHLHESSTEIMYVLTGSCRVGVKTEAQPPHTVTLKKGEFIVLGEGVPHRLLVDRPCRMLNAEFEFVTAADAKLSVRELADDERSIESLLAAPDPFLVLRDDDEEVYRLLKSLVFELDSRGKTSGTFADLLMAQLLIRLARLREDAALNGLQREEWYVKQCVAFLRQNYDRDIMAGEAASVVNLHPAYLQRIFKAQTGRTMMAYLTDIRIEKAKMLLRETDVPAADLYDYVGLGSRSYFHALFKKKTSMTPVEYRKRHETTRATGRAFVNV